MGWLAGSSEAQVQCDKCNRITLHAYTGKKACKKDAEAHFEEGKTYGMVRCPLCQNADGLGQHAWTGWVADEQRRSLMHDKWTPGPGHSDNDVAAAASSEGWHSAAAAAPGGDLAVTFGTTPLTILDDPGPLQHPHPPGGDLAVTSGTTPLAILDARGPLQHLHPALFSRITSMEDRILRMEERLVRIEEHLGHLARGRS